MSEKLNGQYITKVLIYGWYNKGNIGDELFKDAFKQLLPNCELSFVDKLNANDVINSDVIIFGGGSFLYDPPNIECDLSILKSKKILYIGVGIENDINAIHLELMKNALLIATRSHDQFNRVYAINNNTLLIPDIVYALQNSVNKKSYNIMSNVLILPNISVVPKWNSPNWQHVSWNYFKSEFSQFLDYLIDSNCKVSFLSMCENDKESDSAAAIELISSMSKRNKYSIYRPESFDDMQSILSDYDVIITQRYHGIVLAEMNRIKYIAIHHHDKIKNANPGEGKFIPYYGLNKNYLIEQFNLAKNMKYVKSMPIESNIFERLKDTISSLIR